MKSGKQNLHLDLSSSRLAILLRTAPVIFSILAGLAFWLALEFFQTETQNRILIFLIIGLVLAAFFILRRSEFRNLGEFWELTPPEIQKKRLNAEVREIANTLGLSEEDLSHLRAAYVLAEDLVLREIEKEKRVTLKRHIKFANADFSGAFSEKDYSVFVEVMLAVVPTIKQERINEILNKAESVKKKLEERNKKTKLLIAIITQLDPQDEAKLRNSLAKKFSTTTVDIDIRFFDFEALQRIYTED
jgi:hypothetical protein